MDEPSTKPYPPASASELMAVLLSREMADGEAAIVGTNSDVQVAACNLARRTHSPALWWISGPGAMTNPDDGFLRSTADRQNLATATGWFALAEMIEIIDWQDQFFDFAILSGLQIDRFGNLNSVCVGPHQHPKFRGPGVVGISALTALSKRFYILAPRHDVGCFVPKVDFISGAGYLDGGDSRENAGLSGGPALVVSPLGVFDFAPGTRSMRVRSIHPGKSLQEVQAATGFELDISLGVQETVPPTEAELHVLRTQVDVAGALRSL